MQKIIQSQTHSKTQDMQRDYYLNQKKTLEINPRHPLIKELLRRVEDNPADATAKEMAVMMFNTATLRWVSVVYDFLSFLPTIYLAPDVMPPRHIIIVTVPPEQATALPRLHLTPVCRCGSSHY